VNVEQRCLSLKPNNPHVLHLSPLRGVPSSSIGRAGYSGNSTALGSAVFRLLSSSSPANYLLYALLAAIKRAYKVSCSGGSAFMCKPCYYAAFPRRNAICRASAPTCRPAHFCAAYFNLPNPYAAAVYPSHCIFTALLYLTIFVTTLHLCIWTSCASTESTVVRNYTPRYVSTSSTVL
jgi:hypothetical protein